MTAPDPGTRGVDAQARILALTFLAGAAIPVGGHLLLPGVVGDGHGLLWCGAALFVVLGAWVARAGRVTARAAGVLLVGALVGGNALVACGLDPEYRTATAAWNLLIPMVLSASLGRRALTVSVGAAVACAAAAVAVVPGEPVVVLVRSVTVAVLVALPLLYLLGLRAELERALTAARDQARTDTLTGLLNRRGLQESFLPFVQDGGRDGRMLVVTSLDLDHFKRVNDTYGHAAGDAVLVATARAIGGDVRRTDLAVRLGGEELCVVAFMADAGEGRQRGAAAAGGGGARRGDVVGDRQRRRRGRRGPSGRPRRGGPRGTPRAPAGRGGPVPLRGEGGGSGPRGGPRRAGGRRPAGPRPAAVAVGRGTASRGGRGDLRGPAVTRA